MDVTQLKDFVIENDKIQEILEELGCSKFSYHKNRTQIRCAIEVEDNPTVLKINKETLNYKFYGSTPIKKYGDIIILIEELKKYSFSESITFLKNFLGLSNIELNKKERKFPFGGLYHSLKSYSYQELELKTYPKSILNQYINCSNQRFLKDGISLETQKKFNIGYDIITNRITVPWKNTNGEIIGVMGRLNEDSEYCKEINIPKWYPLIPFQKSRVLYGFSENYNYMINNVILIGESEKFTEQLDSMGIYNGVSTGSHSISLQQTLLIKSLYPKQVIICFDEDIDDEQYLIEECKKIQNKSDFFKIQVGYILDKQKKYLKTKQSPTDNGKEVFELLCKECLYWLK